MSEEAREKAGPVPLQATVLFHLNLGYSSVEVEERIEVVRRAYRPLLGLLDEVPGLVVALEAPAHTLELAAELDPEWIGRLRTLVDEGRIELVGSGDTQLIGPLVPASVNRANQRLGREGYARLLGRAPRVALVNEMAWSQGPIDAYLDAGYTALVTEWNNPRRSHPEWEDEWRYGPVRSASPTGRVVDVLFSDAIAFQKFQRAASGELDADEYREWVRAQRGPRRRHLFLYASDAEVFDYRVGRFATEPELVPGGPSEWDRIADILAGLGRDGVRFTTPTRVLEEHGLEPGPVLRLNHASDPVPVKKQPKYNVTRWALTGWDDVGLNARCFARARELERDEAGTEEWRSLCRLWASDHRTHLTERRWRALTASVRDVPAVLRPESDEACEVGAPPDPGAVRIHRTSDRLLVETGGVHLKLNLRRGLAIEALRLRAAGERPLLGTLPHGYFDHIDWAADFYSGHTVVEIPSERRVTDLAPVEPRIDPDARRIEIRADVRTPLGTLEKGLRVYEDAVELFYGFAGWGARPLCSLRTGILTLDPDAFGEELAITAANGGEPERFELEEPCDQGASVSSLISAGAAFGATDGRLRLDDGRVGLELSWPQDEAAALPLVTFQRVGQHPGAKRFVRVSFSLAEIDETRRDGAPLHDFRVAVRGTRIE